MNALDPGARYRDHHSGVTLTIGATVDHLTSYTRDDHLKSGELPTRTLRAKLDERFERVEG